MSTLDDAYKPVAAVKDSDSELEPFSGLKSPKRQCETGDGTRKKQKLCKDAAVYVPGPIQGHCRYPPDEYQDETLREQHLQFKVHPMGDIATYARHIPYSSGKRAFLTTTGRSSLEVFQYQFQVPGDDTIYYVLWDYNIGLVRTTPLFKCTGHSKTSSSKMLDRNPGLREICHSITGGALVAQGYWMPFAAAKAVAANFCWKIRYALTPVFGVDFPGLCLPPDHPKHADMIIDRHVVSQSTLQARFYRKAELSRVTRGPAAVATSAARSVVPVTRSLAIHRNNETRVEAQAIPSDSTSGEDTPETSSDGYDDEGDKDYTISPQTRRRKTIGNDIPRSTPHLAPPRRLYLSRQAKGKFQHFFLMSELAKMLENDSISSDHLPEDEFIIYIDDDEPITSTRADLEAAFLLSNLRYQGKDSACTEPPSTPPAKAQEAERPHSV